MHALVIGGTGMLKKVSMWLCEKGFYVSIIGRDEVKLENVKRMSSAPENITCLSLDYHNDEDVKLAIKSTIKKNGPITLVVAWVHTSAKHALSNICKELDLSSKTYSLFHILGFILEDTYGRWLTHEEIADGIIKGIESKRAEWIVGRVEPWELRPTW
ncbi:short-chain dehydrogenase [Bacillus cereus ATCC 10876]|uniref:short-chain dehydrogenase n=1 Tax=Bacillus TaxID=1386 RepID=UPI00019FF8FE|nr:MULTISPECIES: short-chain dehydrogenase [Bacillus]MBJ3788163.1 short-chain dehydrogenase [Bacillus sp. OA1]MDJ0281400.1 short-chain dehydrogenase [Bacillus bombysepticus]EEK51094.1 Short chain dehydrogenase [Bacillus cereus ATCC 10876]KFL73089.1 putative short chain dehydrogenase [Bacillus cereus ATCC 10876]MBG9868401.1 short-chain dehydrogenase [Bacillus cereus]